MSNEPNEIQRVVLIGIDSIESTLIDQLIDRGEAPSFARLRAKGSWVYLDPGADRDTGLSWEAIWTGRSGAANSRFSAIEFDPATYDVHQHGTQQTPFWAGLGLGGTTIAFDVPYTAALELDDLVTVTAWGASDPGYPRASWPKGLLSEIDARFGPHPACNNDYTIVWNDIERLQKMSQAYVGGAAKRVDVVEWLLDQYPDWKLLITVMSEPHGASEAFWHGIDPNHPLAEHPSAPHAREALLAMVRAQDAAIGRLLSATPDCVHVVVTNGGMATNTADLASMVLLPELLYRSQTGKQRLRWRPRVRAIDALRSGERWSTVIEHRHSHVAWRVGLWRRAPAVARLASFGLHFRGERSRAVVPQDRERTSGLVAWGLFDAGIPVEDPRPASEIGTNETTIDWHPASRYRDAWPAMMAFALPSYFEGRIRLNLIGRERAGIVALADYFAACSSIEALLADCTDGTGQPIRFEVKRRDGDPLMRHQTDCDLEVRWSDPLDTIAHPKFGRIGPVPFRRTGGHDGSKGFAVFDGLPSDVSIDAGVTRPATDLVASLTTLLGRSCLDPNSSRSFVHRSVAAPSTGDFPTL